MFLINQSKLLPLFSQKKKMFAGETCLAKHLNVSPKLRPQVTKKKKNFLKEKKNFRYLMNLEKKPRQFNGVLSPVQDNRYCYSVVFENVRFQPSTRNKYGKAEFSKFESPVYVLKEAQHLWTRTYSNKCK